MCKVTYANHLLCLMFYFNFVYCGIYSAETIANHILYTIITVLYSDCSYYSHC